MEIKVTVQDILERSKTTDELATNLQAVLDREIGAVKAQHERQLDIARIRENELVESHLNKEHELEAQLQEAKDAVTSLEDDKAQLDQSNNELQGQVQSLENEKADMFSRQDIIDMLDQIATLNGPLVTQKAVVKLKELLEGTEYDAETIFKSRINFMAA